MTARPHRILLLVFLALFEGLSVRAVAQTPEQIPEVRLRFLFLDETAGAYSLQTGHSFRQLSATPYAISNPLTAAPGDKLELYKELPATDPAEAGRGKTVRVKIAAVTVPAVPAALVVLTPRPAAPGSGGAPVYDVAFYDGSFPEKSVRIINLGRAAMAARFGDEQALVPPGTARVLSPATDGRNRVFAKIAVQAAAGWTLLSDSITVVRPDERLTGVLVYSPSGLRYAYTSAEIAENGPPPPGHFWLTYGETN
jgi:hypothetical protein